MPPGDPPRLGYVVKRYPRFSETFVVNEILAHERAGVLLDIFAVRRVNEPHFQSILGQVRSPVTYIPDTPLKTEAFWAELRAAEAALPGFWRALGEMAPAEALDVHQAVLLAAKVRELGIGHLHAHFGTVATTIARLAARLAEIGYSFTAHAKDIFHVEVRPEELAAKLRDAVAVVTVSDFNREWLRQHYAQAADGVRRIYNGLDLRAFPYGSPERRAREIVAVGRLVEKKGFDTLIGACALLRERGVAFRCSIIGEGLLHDNLAALIARHELGEQVMLAGPRPQPEVVAAVRQAAACAVPSVIAADGDRDGLPTILIETMALGTPCVSTDVTGIPEIVRQGKTGLIVPQRDPVALADSLARLLDDEALRVRLAESGRALVEQDFDVDRNAATLRGLFVETAAGKARACRVVV